MNMTALHILAYALKRAVHIKSEYIWPISDIPLQAMRYMDLKKLLNLSRDNVYMQV